MSRVLVVEEERGLVVSGVENFLFFRMDVGGGCEGCFEDSVIVYLSFSIVVCFLFCVSFFVGFS